MTKPIEYRNPKEVNAIIADMVEMSGLSEALVRQHINLRICEERAQMNIFLNRPKRPWWKVIFS